MQTSYRAVITTVANAFGLEPRLVEAIVWIESRGQADAFRFEPKFWERYKLAQRPEYADMIPRRASSSYGLMQVMYPTAREQGFDGEPEMLFVPRENLHWGCRILHLRRQWVDGFAAVPVAERQLAMLASYNGGPGGNKPGQPLRPDNKAYALRVLAAYSDLDV